MRSWKWTYHEFPAPRHVVWGQYDATFVGVWTQSDSRRWYEDIVIRAADDGRFYLLVPYCSGFREPEFGHPSDFPPNGTIKEAIAYCERILAGDEFTESSR
jgi:hypothetical protein